MENTFIDKIEEHDIQLVPASLGKRLANYLIDIIIFSFFFTILLKMTAPYFPWATKLLTLKPETIGLMDQLAFSFTYGLYIAITEALLKGKTIAKYITNTRAVTEKGLLIDTQTAFTRGLIRIVPFEQISALSLNFTAPYPWHDRWSKSVVVDEAKSLLPKN